MTRNYVILQHIFHFRNMQPYAELSGDTIQADHDQDDEPGRAPVES